MKIAIVDTTKDRHRELRVEARPVRLLAAAGALIVVLGIGGPGESAVGAVAHRLEFFAEQVGREFLAGSQAPLLDGESADAQTRQPSP